MLHTRREVQADQRLKNVSLVGTLRTRRVVETPFLRHDETLKAWESRFGDTKATGLYPSCATPAGEPTVMNAENALHNVMKAMRYRAGRASKVNLLRGQH